MSDQPPAQPAIDAAEHLPLAMYYAGPYARKLRQPLLDSEPYSDACVGLVRAAAAYDPSRGIAWSTFASIAMKNEMSSNFRTRMTKRDRLPLVTGAEETIDNTACQRSKLQKQIEDREYIEHIFRALNDRQKRFMVAYYLDGFSLRRIGEAETPPVKGAEVWAVICAARRWLQGVYAGTGECTKASTAANRSTSSRPAESASSDAERRVYVSKSKNCRNTLRRTKTPRKSSS